MEWLEAALAFAVVMMVFSTIVAVIVESAHMVFRLREKGLRRFMEVVHKDIVSPRFSRLTVSTSIESFVEIMTRSRFRPADENASALRKLVSGIVNAKELKNLSTTHFLERLTELPEGQYLVANIEDLGRQNVDTFVKDLARKYEEWGESATDYFARRAKLVSVIIAVVLAFALNINALHLFETLLIDKGLHNALIERGDETAQQLEQWRTQLDGLPAQMPPERSKAAQALARNISEIREHNAALRSGSIPFGWEHAPWKAAAWPLAKWHESAWLLMQWGSAVLLTGLLIGLGGPFWFDTFRKLSALTGVTRSIREPPRKISDKENQDRDTAQPEDQSGYLKLMETASRSQRVMVASGGQENNL